MNISNKKADMSGRKIIFYIIFSFVGAITFMLIVYLSSSQESKIAEIPYGLEENMLFHRFLNSPSCFAMYDENIQRAYPQIIDLSKFTKEQIDKCYDPADNLMAFKLTLEYDGKQKQVETRNWQGFLKKSEIRRVFVYDNSLNQDNIRQGMLKTEIQYER